MPRRPMEEPEQSGKPDAKNDVAEKLLSATRDGQDIPAQNLGQQGLALFAKYGVPLRRNGDKVDCHMFRDGKDVVLFQFAPTAEGMTEAEGKLDKLVADEQKLLQQQYHVKFNTERTPRLNELYGIESALKQSQPANLQATTGDGIAFNFPKQAVVPDQLASLDVAHNTIDLHHNMALGTLVSEADVAKFGVPDAESSMQLSIGTELSRNSLHRTGMDENSTDLLNTAAKLGWHRTKDDQWLLEHRNGTLYSFDQQRELWVERDPDGKPLGGILDANQMQREAKVPLITAYVANPTEELADALTLFRISEKERANFFKSSPELYKLVKAIDQRDINEAYGGTIDKPRLVRLPDGTLVSNTADNLQTISRFEK